MPTATIGHVTRERYEQIIATDRELVGQMQRIQFTIGDHALEIEPMQQIGGARPAPGEDLFGVDVSLQIYADDLGLSLSTVRSYRFAAHRWPAGQRRHGISHKVHYILASIPDDTERFEAIDAPPLDERARARRWTTDLAKKHVGQRPDRPETPAQKVAAIHRLADDDEVAAQIATDVLRRPQVAAKVVADDTARHMVNKAQTTQHRTEVVHDLIDDDTVAAQVASDVLRRPEVAARVVADDTARHAVNRAQTDRSRQQAEHFRRETPAGRAVKKIERTAEFLDLVGACHRFVAACGKTVPKLRDRHLSDDEQAVLAQNVARCRATLDWIETAAETGEVDVDEELARLLRGE
ncbi:DUF6192 family protein [Streptomyces sp. CA-210063]|uniref:DUF6192 family protein n=1 Tax=Streptomyces sp. CA-210063 TaxID=2801029 RepID=UPI00214CA878|nr:DUF6192 family protein [Streptomyces sp. CA-210063]UUU32287.1 DUF6192 family protein [Streptomyces sp. CA-210063]